MGRHKLITLLIFLVCPLLARGQGMSFSPSRRGLQPYTNQPGYSANLGSLAVTQLASPASAPSLALTGGGSGTTWGYEVADALPDGTYNAVSSQATISGPSSLSGSNYITISHSCATGAATWTVWRWVSVVGGAPSLIGKATASTSIPCSTGSINDTGWTGDSTAAFTGNTTGGVKIGTGSISTSAILQGMTPPTFAAGTTQAQGFAFSVAYSTTVTQLGRYCAAADAGTHGVYLWQAGNSSSALASSSVTCASTAQFVMASITPVTLTPGVGYFVLVNETSGGDKYSGGWNPGSFLTPDLGAMTQIFSVAGSTSTYPTYMGTDNQVFSFPQMTLTVNAPDISFVNSTDVRYANGSGNDMMDFHGYSETFWPLETYISGDAGLHSNAYINLVGTQSGTAPYTPTDGSMLFTYQDVKAGIIQEVQNVSGWYFQSGLDTSGNVKFKMDKGGFFTVYNSQTTVGNGVPGEIATVDLTAQSAALSAKSILASLPASGMYRVTWVAKVTTAATTSSTLGGSTGFQVIYTDADDSTASVTSPSVSGGPTGNALTTQWSGSVLINGKTGTGVTCNFGYTSSGATPMQYAIHIKLEQM